MAKKKAEPNDAQKATLDARQKLELATKAHTDKPTDATKKHLEAMATAVKMAQHTENRDRFVRIAGGRVKKIRTAIRNLAGVAQPRSYVYAEEDVAKAESVLTAELKITLSKMRSALTRGAGAAKAEDDFSF